MNSTAFPAAAKPHFSGKNDPLPPGPTPLAPVPSTAPDGVSFDTLNTSPHDRLKGALKLEAPRYGRLQNNIREVVRIALMNVLPLALAPISLAGWPGFILSLALMPLLYVAGRAGRSIGKHVDPENLTGALRLFRQLHALVSPTLTMQERKSLQQKLSEAPSPEARESILQEFRGRDHLDKINQTLSDFAATAKLPKLFSFFIPNDQFRQWMMTALKMDGATRTGRFVNAIINNQTLFRSQVFSDIANSETAGIALRSGAKGVWQGFIDFTFMPKVGMFLTQMASAPWCPPFLKPVLLGLGETCKNWFVAKSAWDAASLFRRTS
jgi:hypothetical protein